MRRGGVVELEETGVGRLQGCYEAGELLGESWDRSGCSHLAGGRIGAGGRPGTAQERSSLALVCAASCYDRALHQMVCQRLLLGIRGHCSDLARILYSSRSFRRLSTWIGYQYNLPSTSSSSSSKINSFLPSPFLRPFPHPSPTTISPPPHSPLRPDTLSP
jgi:hypothetical protein